MNKKGNARMKHDIEQERYVERFVLNEFIDVVLTQFGKTEILVEGEPFEICKHVLVSMPAGQFEGINSIDQLAATKAAKESERLYRSNMGDPEFCKAAYWAHCSNLQAWVEHDYDTHILHSNLSFSLLKELVKRDDQKAKRVLEAEIVDRIKENYYDTTFAIIVTFRPYFEYRNHVYDKLEDMVWNAIIAHASDEVLQRLVEEHSNIFPVQVLDALNTRPVFGTLLRVKKFLGDSNYSPEVYEAARSSEQVILGAFKYPSCYPGDLVEILFANSNVDHDMRIKIAKTCILTRKLARSIIDTEDAELLLALASNTNLPWMPNIVKILLDNAMVRRRNRDAVDVEIAIRTLKVRDNIVRKCLYTIFNNNDYRCNTKGKPRYYHVIAVNYPDVPLRKRLARTTIPEEIARQLVRDPSLSVRLALAGNAQWFGNGILMPLLRRSRLERGKNEHQRLLKVLAGREGLPLITCMNVYREGNDGVLLELARNATIPKQVLHLLYRSSSKVVKRSVISTLAFVNGSNAPPVETTNTVAREQKKPRQETLQSFVEGES